MKKLLIIIVLLAGSLMISSFNIQQDDFCEGWDEGYQEAMDGCFGMGITPICPIAPIGKDTYKHGFGMGYARGEKDCKER